MSRLKYIVLDDMNDTALIFPNWVNHSDMVQGRQKVLSAGSIDIAADGDKIVVSCFGESFSLKVKSRGEVDSRIVARLIN